jgi:hypothetical protein
MALSGPDTHKKYSVFGGLVETVCFSETLAHTYLQAHSVTTQKINIDIFTAVGTSNLNSVRQ